MSELKVSGTLAGSQLLEKVDVLVASKPKSWGDGEILQWLMANSVTIFSIIKQIIALFKADDDADETPGPVA